MRLSDRAFWLFFIAYWPLTMLLLIAHVGMWWYWVGLTPCVLAVWLVPWQLRKQERRETRKA